MTDQIVDSGDPSLVLLITQSVTANAKSLAAEENVLFDRMATPVLSSGFLRWYEAENLSQATKGCQSAWMDLRETYPDWSNLLRELDSINDSNRCGSCLKKVFLKSNRQWCSIPRWNEESAQRAPDFHGLIDIVIISGLLSFNEGERISSISKTCYKIRKTQCTCCLQSRRAHLEPYLKHDPRYADKYYDMGSDLSKCQTLTRYIAWMIRNLHSFYNFERVTDTSKLPNGLRTLEFCYTRTFKLCKECYLRARPRNAPLHF